MRCGSSGRTLASWTGWSILPRTSTHRCGATQSAVEPLIGALQDASVTVRRTAGDALSDLADKRAIPAMVRALADPSRLVRWRATRLLYEVGEESVLGPLRAVAADPEFEVRIERIVGGDGPSGRVWQRMIGAGDQ